MSSRTRTLLLASLVLLLVAFLLGFLPQYQRASALQQELEQAQARIQTLERSAKLMRARDLAQMIYLETARKNYGTAVQYAEQFFGQVQSLAGQVEDPALKSGLTEIYNQREAVIAELSQVAPTAEERVRKLVDQVRGLTAE